MLTTDCDKSDYILAACSGAICGILDIFLVGKPGESPIGDVTDKWFENRTMDFAKMCGWNDKENNTLSSAIEHLEKSSRSPMTKEVQVMRLVGYLTLIQRTIILNRLDTILLY